MRNIYFLYLHLWDSYRYDFGGCALVSIINEFNKKNIYVIDIVLYYVEAIFNFKMAAIQC